MNAALEKVRASVLGDAGYEVLELLKRLQAGESPGTGDQPVLDLLEASGLYQSRGKNGQLTPLGGKCATPAREYVFWVERGRRLHAQGEAPVLSLDMFRNKSVLEVGPGWGCNLFSLQPVARRVCGVEIEPFYVELSKMIAAREGVQPPEIRVGMAEDLPVESEAFDWVILFSALQYMDVGRAVREIARVLKPGGRVLVMQKTLGVFLRRQATREGVQSASPRTWISNAGIVLDSLTSGLNGCRVRKLVKMRPAFPTSRGLVRQFARVGLVHSPALSCEHRRPLCCFSCEHSRPLCRFVAEKPCD
jgi:SAM-dependent methyltransferase